MFSWISDFAYICMELAVLTLLFLYFLYLSHQFSEKWTKKYPPGPLGLPVLGYLPFIVKETHLKLERLTKKYGNIVGFYLGKQYCVLLGDICSIKEAFNRPEFSGKYPRSSLSLHCLLGDSYSSKLHALITCSLQDFLDSKMSRKNFIEEEVQLLLREVEKRTGEAVTFRPLLTRCTLNVMCQFLFGKTFDEEDATNQFLRVFLEEEHRYAKQIMCRNFVPWVHVPILNEIFGTGIHREHFRELVSYFNEEIEEHMYSFDEEVVRDFIDAFLLEMESHERVFKGASILHVDKLPNTLYTLLVAGSESIRSCLEWVFWRLARTPEVQNRIHDEINYVIGCDRLPEANDMKNMPKTQSFIMEVQRYHPVIPMIFNYTSADARLSRFYIPKHTVVLSNIWALHRDRRQWKQPWHFDPDRFLSEDKKSVVQPRVFLPFSVGKRKCPAENFAREEIFIFLACVLQKFSLHVPDDEDLGIEEDSENSTQTKSYKLKFVKRI